MTAGPPVLITGAAGFIGRRLAQDLCRSGVPVRALMRPEHDEGDLPSLGAEILRGDASDADLMSQAAEGCSAVYQLAAARGPKKLSLANYLRLNTALLDAAATACLATGARLVAASTVRVMDGWPPGTPAHCTPLRPTSRYGASRARCETRLAEHWRPRGLDFRIARIAERVAGPGARDWHRFAIAVRDGRYRWLPTGGCIHSCDVDDVVTGLELCAGDRARAGETYVLTAAAPESMERLLSRIAETLGVRFAPLRLPRAPALAYKRVGDAVFSAIGRELPYAFTAGVYACPNRFDGGGTDRQLGFVPRYDVAQAVQRAVQWMMAEGLL